jgi:hypothetical protein
MELLASLSLYSRTMLGLCAALLLVILTEVLFLGGESGAAVTVSNTQGQDSAAPGAVSQSLQIPPVVAYREVTERPLFSDSRRPPPQTKAAGNSAAQATQLVGKWKVTGIVVAGDSSFALVEGIRDRKTVRLQLGMPLDGWQLEEIHPDHLVFNAADTTATLLLHNEEDGQGGRQR